MKLSPMQRALLEALTAEWQTMVSLKAKVAPGSPPSALNGPIVGLISRGLAEGLDGNPKTYRITTAGAVVVGEVEPVREERLVECTFEEVEREGHKMQVGRDASGVVWVVASGACAMLGLEQVTRALSRISSTHKGVTSSKTLGGEQQVNVIDAQGFDELIMSSRTPAAQAVKEWWFGGVLKALRETGHYEMPAGTRYNPLGMDGDRTALEDEDPIDIALRSAIATRAELKRLRVEGGATKALASRTHAELQEEVARSKRENAELRSMLTDIAGVTASPGKQRALRLSMARDVGAAAAAVSKSGPGDFQRDAWRAWEDLLARMYSVRLRAKAREDETRPERLKVEKLPHGAVVANIMLSSSLAGDFRWLEEDERVWWVQTWTREAERRATKNLPLEE